MGGLKDFSKLEIPRWIGYSANSLISAEIHVFGDASESAYGAVVYIRLQRKNENPSIILLASKTRVAPLPKKKVTLPRLELLSSLLAIRLGEKVRTSLHIESWRTIYWSDSRVTLGWIRGDPNRWKPFVRNQVESVRKFSTLLVEALSWGGESSRSRLPGSASTSTGRVTAVVEWSSLVEKRRRRMAEFSTR